MFDPRKPNVGLDRGMVIVVVTIRLPNVLPWQHLGDAWWLDIHHIDTTHQADGDTHIN